MIFNLTTPYGVSLEVLNQYLKSLYDADWEDERGAIRFSADIKLAELARAKVFHNARIFLNALLEEGGAPTTAAGYLNREFVGRVIDRLQLPADYLKTTRLYRKVIDERDVWPLHKIRLVAEYGKLVVRRNKCFRVTKLGRELLADDRAGELFRRLFLTYFRKLDLCYLTHVREQPEIQATLAVTLWRLEQVADNWRAVKGMAAQILPPRVQAHIISQQQSESATPDFFVSVYVLNTLREFGLLERQRDSEWCVEEKDVVRVLPLFRRLIHFSELPSLKNN